MGGEEGKVEMLHLGEEVTTWYPHCWPSEMRCVPKEEEEQLRLLLGGLLKRPTTLTVTTVLLGPAISFGCWSNGDWVHGPADIGGWSQILGTKGARGWEIQETWIEGLLTRLPCRTGAGAGPCPGPLQGQRM